MKRAVERSPPPRNSAMYLRVVAGMPTLPRRAGHGDNPGDIDDVAHLGGAERTCDGDGRDQRGDKADHVFQAIPRSVAGDCFAIHGSLAWWSALRWRDGELLAQLLELFLRILRDLTSWGPERPPFSVASRALSLVREFAVGHAEVIVDRSVGGSVLAASSSRSRAEA